MQYKFIMSKKFYITTPIYYVNDKPHIGHSYTTTIADILARYHRMKGEKVLFLTGTDENSQKNVEAAEKSGEKNIKKYLDKIAAIWQETWDSFGISNDDFIRTTEKRHIVAVNKFFETVWKKKDIYEGSYEGWYCAGCEAFKKESDLVNGLCPDHKKAPEKIKENNLFFRVTKYRDALLEFIGKNPEFIQPKSRRNEVVNFIRDYMEDFSITRENASCGIPVPKIAKYKKNASLYVWFDALLNYVSAIGYGKNPAKFKKFWPADLHLVGKDIIKFHCAYWPAMLMSAGLPLPKKVFAHGFFTINGEKISKSLGNAIDPLEVSKKFGIDAIRYFLIREIRLGEDGDFSFERLNERYNNELANELGNLISRVLAMTEKYFDGKTPKKAPARLFYAWKEYDEDMENLRLNEALEKIWQIVREANRIIDSERPWELAKINQKRLAEVIYVLLETFRHLAWMLYPIMPGTAEKIWEGLGIAKSEKKITYKQARKWGGLKQGTKVKKGEALFPRL